MGRMMEVTVLGSGVTAPNQRRGEPGHHVKLPGASILWDGGSGTRARLLAAGIDQFALTHVAYTHLHTDHVSEFAPLLFSLRNSPNGRRTSDLVVYGPPGFQRYHDALRAVSGEGRWWDTKDYRLHVHETHGARHDLGAFSLQSVPVNHMDYTANGYRIEDGAGHAVAFSGDTGECDELVELGRDADLFLLECSHPDDEPREGHMTPRACGRIARRARVRHLVLVHMYPACDEHDLAAEVAAEWDGRVTVAEDLKRFTVP